jgi:23S rRNA pseudouridine1911/1915/1917 synthase
VASVVSDVAPTPDEDVEHDLDVEVPPLLDGVRADRALSMLTGCTRAVSGAVIDAGALRVDGVVVKKGSQPLEVGQRLVATLPDPEAAVLVAEPDVEVCVVVEDPSFLVVDKPAGLVVHPGAGHSSGTLIAGLLARYPELAALGELEGAAPHRPGIVQRLDKGTSGVLVIARTGAAFASLSAQLQARTVERRYAGLVEGDVQDDSGVIDAPIGRSQRTPTKMAVRSGGRPARTAYEVRTRFAAPARTLLDLRLESGRTHQIRVHLAAIGRPIVNDPRYGQHREPALAEGRVFLHAAVLGFAHPVSATPVRVTSPLPQDLQSVLDALSG